MMWNFGCSEPTKYSDGQVKDDETGGEGGFGWQPE
jgi:hypothetical protein